MPATNPAELSPVERALRIEKEVHGVSAQYGVKSEDSQFLRSIVEKNRRSLPHGAAKWLRDIEKRVFGDEDGL